MSSTGMLHWETPECGCNRIGQTEEEKVGEGPSVARRKREERRFPEVGDRAREGSSGYLAVLVP